MPHGRLAQIKKEIKSVIQRHMNINDDAYEVRIIMRDKKSINNL
jgi:septum formation topological specificity factor MinE